MPRVPGTAESAVDEVLSGEAIAIDVQPIGFFLRVLGALIDVVFALALTIAFLVLLGWLSSLGVLDGGTSQILNILALVTCLVIVPCAMEVALRGRSLGKLAVGGRIVRTDGGATGFRHAFIRALLGVLEIWMTLGAVAIITGIFTARAQRLGDLVAGTYSQRVRLPRLDIPAPALPRGLEAWAGVADVARLPDRLARRVSQFLQHAERMAPPARTQVAQSLLAEAAPFVSPVPPAGPETALAAIMAVRRERETRALRGADARAAALLGPR